MAGKTKDSRAEVTERLLEGEKIVSEAVIHNGIYWKAVAVFILAVLVAFFVVFELGVLLAVTAGFMALYAMIKKSILMLAVTDKRIFARYGILQVDVVDVHFDKIESVELERMLPGYIMGYSNVVMMGTGNRFIVIPYVANGTEIRRAYNQLVLNEHKGKEVVIKDSAKSAE